jgi:hypothetical protein
MLMLLVTLSAIAVMVFVEWQYSVMSRRVKVRTEARPEPRLASRARRR